MDTRASFDIAMWFATWAAIGLLALIAAGLHWRLRTLEQASRMARDVLPYSHLTGRRIRPAGQNGQRGWDAELILVLSSHCPSCERILDELRNGHDWRRIAVAWKDGGAETTVTLPSGVTTIEDGARLCAQLGIGVTPFALEVDENGVIVKAIPIGTLETLGPRRGRTAAAWA